MGREDGMLTRYYYIGEFSKYIDILKAYPHKEKIFQRGEYLCAPSSALKSIYFVEKGLTKLSVTHDSGEDKIFGFWGEGSIFPIICTEQKFNLEYSILMKAVTSVKTIVFTPEVFKKILHEHDAVTYEVVDHYCRFCNMLLFNTTAQSYESVLTRICNVIYTYLYYVKPENGCVQLSQEDIASIIGASRVTVARELSELRNQEIIKTSREKIFVLDHKKIQTYASEYCK